MRKTLQFVRLAALLLLSATAANAQVSAETMGKVLPVEIFVCKYNDGQGPADLDKVVARWTRYMDEQENRDYAAWTLTPYFYGAEQDFDLIWMGAYTDGNAWGAGTDNWLANGGALQAEFAKLATCDTHVALSSAMYKAPPDGTPASGVITMMACELNEGHTYKDIRAAELKWVEHLEAQQSPVGYWHWFPLFGGGNAEFDYKIVSAYRNFSEVGAEFERNANGGGREIAREIFADIDECDEPRVYLAKNRRAAPLR